jgi:ABC-type transporter Mla MlaB component
MAESTLRIELVLRTNDAGRLVLAGDLTAATAADLPGRLRALIHGGPLRSILVDLAEVESIDPDGVATLVTLWRLADKAGISARFAFVPSAALDYLAAELDLSVFDSDEDH